uniref:protein-tyrosine-phosphatase n=1 Tax=Crassostrea virginica TaxID=6565 RepID=A0A8B8C4M0_CRAVI|nr:receptor-type tyrosine-protein phosphatase alpha-like isoform X2 [Crassostrea virginica]
MWLGWFLFLRLVTTSSGFVNIAYKPSQGIYGTASMSEPPREQSWSAAKAIDGNTDQTIPNCAVMDFSKNYRSVWWKVRLARRFNVAYLEVFFRKNFTQRSSGYFFYIYDTSDTFNALSPLPNNLIYHHDPLSGCPSPFQNITVNRLGVEIIFTNQRPEGYVSSCYGDEMTRTGVELCEVKVMGCDQNRYSSNQCRTRCPQKCRNQNCDAFNGSCIYGCHDPKALTLDCIVCKDMDYISNRTCVSCQGHCKDGSPCNKSTGRCDNGCQNHWIGEFCEVCSPYYYGIDCNTSCGQCRGDDVCNNVTGYCPYGCKQHWDGLKCDICKDGFYNNNCDAPCGHCSNDAPCNKVNGTCTEGCKPNFKTPLCRECLNGFYGYDCNSTCKNCNITSPGCLQSNGHCLSGCESNKWLVPKCDVLTIQGHQNPVENGPDTASLAGGLMAVIIAVAVTGVAILVMKRRGEGQRKNTHGNTIKPKPLSMISVNNPALETSEEHLNETIIGDDGGYYNTDMFTTDIRFDDLRHVISEKSKEKNSIFHCEYKRLPAGKAEKCTAGQKQENIIKNRFKTTFPYDHSRIILKEKWNENDNDYVNANYIKDFSGERTYIAAQGPKDVTLLDFWRLLWQENVRFIVMLTNLVENGKNKCIQYWPEKDKVLSVGPCNIKLLQETVYAFYTQRTFNVEQNSYEKRTITQFHYTAWPDHGTPEELGLVQFHKAVTKKYQSGGPMLVHCSAGVGRTGTFIGLDSLLKQGLKTGRINVFEFVKQIREDRMTMVQTVGQYIFLHKALLFGCQQTDTNVAEEDISEKLSSLLQDNLPLKQSFLYKEHKLLQSLRDSNGEKDEKDVEKAEDMNKENKLNVPLDSKYRPFLTSCVTGRDDYINAVYVPSYTSPNAFILTQYPLKDTEIDLWRLCVDHDVRALVILDDTGKEIPWIPQKSSSSCCSSYTLTSGYTSSNINGIHQSSLEISIEEQNKKLDVLRIPSEDDVAILKGVEILMEKEKSIKFTSIILSKNGASPAGIFCVLHNVLQQLRMDKEVDIFTAVRQIQTRIPEVITKLDEYSRCYKRVLLWKTEDQIYANM